MTKTTFEEEKLREFEEKIAPLIVKDYNEFGEIGEMDLEEILTERVNTFLLSSLRQQREMMRKEVEKLEGKPIHYLDILSLLSDKEIKQ